MRAMSIDAVFLPFLVDTSINRKFLDSFLKSIFVQIKFSRQWLHDHKLRIFLLVKIAKFNVTFVFILLINQNFLEMFENAFCSYQKFIEIVCQVKFKIYEISF